MEHDPRNTVMRTIRGRNLTVYARSAENSAPASADIDAALQTWGKIFDLRFVVPNLGIPSRRCVSICRICGRFDRMTFEHLPPQAVGNNAKVVGAGLDQLLRSDDPFTIPSQGHHIQQRGSGGYILCAACNAYCGNTLIPEYSMLINTIDRQFKALLDERGYTPSYLDITLDDFDMRLVARQVLAILLGASGGPGVVRLWPALRDLVLSDVGGMPAGVQILAHGVLPTSRTRIVPPTVFVKQAEAWLFIEVCCSPIAWQLAVNRKMDPAPYADVTRWFDQDSRRGILPLKIGWGDSPIPLDFRSIEQARREAAQ